MRPRTPKSDIRMVSNKALKDGKLKILFVELRSGILGCLTCHCHSKLMMIMHSLLSSCGAHDHDYDQWWFSKSNAYK